MLRSMLLCTLLAVPLAAQGSITPIGIGCEDANGRFSALASLDPPVAGNAQFTVTLTQATPGSPTLLFIALVPATPPFPLGSGCNLYLDLQSLYDMVALGIGPVGPLPATGNGSVVFPVPIPQGLSGLHVYLQAAILDPALAIGFSVTNALDVSIG